MVLAKKIWGFATTGLGWTSTVSTYTATQGNPAGSWEHKQTSLGGPLINVTAKVRLVDTWANIFGIPSTATVNNFYATDGIHYSGFQYYGTKTVPGRQFHGPLYLFDSGFSTLLLTLITSTASSAGTWLTKGGILTAAIPSSHSAASTTIGLEYRQQIRINAGGVGTATSRMDNMILIIDYTDGRLKDPIQASVIAFAR